MAEEKLVFNLYLPSRGGSRNPSEVVLRGGSCFSQGTASSITLSLAPAASQGGKGSTSLTAPATISNQATVCCFFGSEWNTPNYVFNRMVLCAPVAITSVVVILPQPLFFPS